jgi:lipopolysaccharide export system permease protein
MIIVLDRMIAMDVVKTLISVWSVIVVIIVSRKFIKVLDKAIEGEISNETLMTILGLKTIVAGVAFLPAALFMAVLMVLGRMYRDQEMSAVASAGGGAGTIYRAVFLAVFPLGVLTAGLSLYTAPWAEARMDKLISQDGQSADIRGIAEGKFSEYSQGDLVFYVEEIAPDKTMHKIFVQHRQKNKLGIINAETGRISDLPEGTYIIFTNGERIQGRPGDLDYVIEQFNDYAVRLETKEAAAGINREAIPVDQLWSSKQLADIAELQRRFSIPLGLILLSFLAVPLAQVSPRGGVYGNILTGFLIYFTYGNLVRVSHSWIMNATISPWLGGTGVNALLILIGATLLARLYGWRWLLMKIRERVAR